MNMSEKLTSSIVAFLQQFGKAALVIFIIEIYLLIRMWK